MGSTGTVVTYGQLNDESLRLARLLREGGLEREDHLAILVENHPSFLPICWAAQRSGLHYTPISTRLTPAEAAFIVADCGAKALVASSALADLAMEAAGPNVKVRLILDGDAKGFDRYETALEEFPAEPLADEAEGADMLYSSGTTGRPKGVKRPHIGAPIGTPSPVVLVAQGLFGFDAATVYLSTAPLYHAAPLGFSMAVQRLGGTVVVMEHFDAALALALIDRYEVTHSQWVPTMFMRLLRLPDEVRKAADLRSHRVAVHAAAPCPVPVKRSMIEWWGPILHEYYSGTEGNGFVYCNSSDWLAHEGTVGRSLLGGVRILGDDGSELEAGVDGTVYFDSGLPVEYHGDPEASARVRDPLGRGWTTLGDIGHVDNDGFLYLTDRKTFMIVSGGVNIYPQEIENVLLGHEQVADAAVFGVPNQEFGEEVKAIVQLIPETRASADLEQQLLDYCRTHLSPIKCPRSIEFRPELPRLPTGKLLKQKLRDEYWAGHATRLV